MKIAVISDIHGNFEALKKVLEDIESSGVSSIICLGDNIGYGPEPEKVVRQMRRQNIPTIKGNHELALVSPAYFKKLNPTAQQSMTITRSLVSPETLVYCDELPPALRENNIRYVHGCPPRAITRYLFRPDADELARIFSSFSERICFFGHTHNLMLYSQSGDKTDSKKLTRGTITLDSEARYLINIGSVGQPRDGNNNAKYVIWDSTANQLEIRFVNYPVKAVIDKILALGFPEFNATRLL